MFLFWGGGDSIFLLSMRCEGKAICRRLQSYKTSPGGKCTSLRRIFNREHPRRLKLTVLYYCLEERNIHSLPSIRTRYCIMAQGTAQGSHRQLSRLAQQDSPRTVFLRKSTYSFNDPVKDMRTIWRNIEDAIISSVTLYVLYIPSNYLIIEYFLTTVILMSIQFRTNF